MIPAKRFEFIVAGRGRGRRFGPTRGASALAAGAAGGRPYRGSGGAVRAGVLCGGLVPHLARGLLGTTGCYKWGATICWCARCWAGSCSWPATYWRACFILPPGCRWAWSRPCLGYPSSYICPEKIIRRPVASGPLPAFYEAGHVQVDGRQSLAKSSKPE